MRLGGSRAALRGLVAAAVAATAALLGAPAWAAPPPTLDGYVTDLDGALTTEEEQRLESRLGALAAADDLPELFVVFAERFEQPSDALDWVDATADHALLGSNQYLVAVATVERHLVISSPDDGPLSQQRVDEILDLAGSRHFGNEEWAAGVELMADEFEQRPWPWWVWVLGIAGLAFVIFLIVQGVNALRAAARRRAELRTLEGQKQRSARELVRADNAVRNSAQELGFVTAEFGEETTAEFTAVVADCRAKLAHAFELQQLLEDTEADTPEQTRAWTDEILATCASVHSALDDKKRALANLRDLVANAESSHARLAEERRKADDLVASAARRIETLAASHPAADVALVADHADEMRRVLEDADEWLAALAKAAAARSGPRITRAIHEVEADLAEVAELHEDVAEHAQALDARRAGVAAPPASGTGPLPLFRPTPGASGPLAAAERTLERAHAVVQGARDAVSTRDGSAPPSAAAQLAQADRALQQAEEARPGDPALVESAARRAMERAELARRFAGSRPSSFARTPGRYTDEAAYPRSSRRAITAYEDDSEGRGAKAVFGAIGGGVVGGFGGAAAADGGDAGGMLLFGAVVGALLGALSGAFGSSEGGGSSGGWSSRSSGGWSSSRSSGGSRSFSSGRSGGGRSSSGRSGRSSSGRRF